MSECTINWTLKQMDYSSRRPLCQLRMGNWGYKIGKTCLFCVSISAATFKWHRGRIWHKRHGSLNSLCFVSAVQASGGGVMVWGYFLAALRCIWALFNMLCLKIVADHVHPFMTIPSSDGYGNTLFEGVCIRLTWHCHKHDITPVMNMKESIWMFMTVVI